MSEMFACFQAEAILSQKFLEIKESSFNKNGLSLCAWRPRILF